MDTDWERISELDDQWNPQKPKGRRTKTQKKKRKEKKRKRNRREIQGLRGSYKRGNMYMMGITEGGGGEKGTEGIFEILMTKSFSKLMSDTKLQI